MNLEHSIAFFLFAVIAAVTPGPSNIMLTATGAAAGLLRGLPCLLGVAAGMGILIFTVALGLGSLVIGHPIVLQILNWTGAAFLLWLAWKIATADPGDRNQAEKPVGFLGAALFQWINPKSWIASTGAVGSYLQPDAGSALLQSITFAEREDRARLQYRHGRALGGFRPPYTVVAAASARQRAQENGPGGDAPGPEPTRSGRMLA
jgi:threonine/homoserine/homoserine lactone efflux protein